MTMPESQSEPEPPSTSSLPTVCESAQNADIHWHILIEAGSAPDATSGPALLTDGFVERCCRSTLVHQNLMDLTGVSDVELSVQLLDSRAMQQLNLQYRQKDRPTNVLSFASDMPLMVAATNATTDTVGAGLLILGDLVLCPDVIAREASEQAKIPLQHWAHMLVHGTLHLCGYDHEDEREAQAMEAIEILVLSGLDIANPYAVSNVVNEQ